MPVFKRKSESVPSTPAANGTMRGSCPACGNNPGYDWAVCPRCGHMASPVNTSIEVIEPSRAAAPSERARFTEERDFYRAVPQVSGDTGATVIERGFEGEETMLEGATVIERTGVEDTAVDKTAAESDKTVILRSGPRPEPRPAPPPAADDGYQGPLAFVIERNGANTGKAHLLRQESYLGRAAESDITIANNAVSKRHARIRYEDGRYVFWDLASSNFSFLVGADGERTRILDPHPLTDGDTIDLGDARLTFLDVAPE